MIEDDENGVDGDEGFDNENEEAEGGEAETVAREPGYYVGDNGPYETEEDAQAYIDGHLDGEGEITNAEAND